MFKLGQFLEVGKDFDTNKYRSADRTYDYTISGHIIYNIGTVVPVINRRGECIAVAKILEFTVSEFNTTVRFTFNSKIKQETRAAFTRYYQSIANIEADDGDDPYSDNYAPLPGVVSATNTTKKSLDDAISSWGR
jgi:hypothetical protein